MPWLDVKYSEGHGPQFGDIQVTRHTHLVDVFNKSLTHIGQHLDSR